MDKALPCPRLARRKVISAMKKYEGRGWGECDIIVGLHMCMDCHRKHFPKMEALQRSIREDSCIKSHPQGICPYSREASVVAGQAPYLGEGSKDAGPSENPQIS